MKYSIFTILTIAFVLSSCKNSSSEEEPNPYWEVNLSFTPPANWKTYTFADAFSISVPEYMNEELYDLYINEDSLNDKNARTPFAVAENTLNEDQVAPGETRTMTFKPNHSLKGYNNYSRIYIEYRQGNNGDFPARLDDNPRMYNQDGVELSKQLIKQCLDTGILLCVLERTWLPLNAGMGLDICYRRMGHDKDDGSTTVHIFILKDYDKMIFMTISYNTKYKDSYKDLFNVVNTIRWTKPNIISK